MLIQSAGSTDCKPRSRDCCPNLVWVTQEGLIPGPWKKAILCSALSRLTPYRTCSTRALCVFQRQCVFLTLLLGAPGQSVSTDGVTATAAQTAEVCSCGAPLTESYRDHIVRTQVQSTMDESHKGIVGEKTPSVPAQGFFGLFESGHWPVFCKVFGSYTLIRN